MPTRTGAFRNKGNRRYPGGLKFADMVTGGLPDRRSGVATRVQREGCATSAATAELGALSFPARSTAVTVYQYCCPDSTVVSRYVGEGNSSGVNSEPRSPSLSLR